LLAFPTSTDCKFVRDCVSLRTFSQYSSEELQGLSPLPAFFTRPDDSIVSEHVLLYTFAQIVTVMVVMVMVMMMVAAVEAAQVVVMVDDEIDGRGHGRGNGSGSK